MPKNKDLKRLTRARMDKTGESYTAARAQLLAGEASPRKSHAELAGMSDDAVEAKTGKDWQAWVEALDAAGAAEMSHRDIAKHVGASYDVSGWWAQAVTVGYERIRGLRDVGQRRGAGGDRSYDANKSRTFPVPVDRLYRAFRDVRVRRKWLPDGFAEVTTARPNESIRARSSDGTRVELHFTDKGSKSSVSIQHRKLPSHKDAERLKKHWHERLDALGELLR